MAVVKVVFQQWRCISTSNACFGKRNFRKFLLFNKRGTKIFKERQTTRERDPELFHDLGVRPVGYETEDGFVKVPEMIPELIVPDLTGFKFTDLQMKVDDVIHCDHLTSGMVQHASCDLKPYVSYRTPDVVQSEFTPKDLFDAVYSEKIANDFKNGKLSETGEPLEPSPEEQLTSEEAYNQARKTGADIF